MGDEEQQRQRTGEPPHGPLCAGSGEPLDGACGVVFAPRGTNAPRRCVLDRGHAGGHKDAVTVQAEIQQLESETCPGCGGVLGPTAPDECIGSHGCKDAQRDPTPTSAERAAALKLLVEAVSYVEHNEHSGDPAFGLRDAAYEYVKAREAARTSKGE